MIKAKVTTKVTGQARVDTLRREIAKMKGSYVTIGIHSDVGSRKYTEGNNPPEVYEVALWMEYGTARGIPARSYIGATVDENAEKIHMMIAEAKGKILAGQSTCFQELDKIGFKIMVMVQNKIKSNVPPPLNKEYAARKIKEGFAPDTLRRTETLLSSVAYNVHVEGGK